jgi:glyoxylase-like metal-dependent hydrolase (beta-lactamase superfamily II)
MRAHHDDRQAAGHGHSHPTPPAGGGLVQLSPSLYWYRDTCNVYLLVRGDRGLLIDFGSGGILEHLDEAGIQVEWVLHTHHHRDQCQGDHLLEARGIPIAVPEREAALFAETDAFWRMKRIYDNYDTSSIGFTLARPVPVARTLRDYETFAWRGYDIRVLPTPGHTKGSITFATEIDGVVLR